MKVLFHCAQDREKTEEKNSCLRQIGGFKTRRSNSVEREWLVIKIPSDLIRDIERTRADESISEFYEKLIFIGWCEYKKRHTSQSYFTR